MRRYETIFITHPDLTEEEQAEFLEKVRGLVTNLQGDIIKLDDWGAKKLSYIVRKNSRGRFFLLDYLAPSSLVRELERTLRLNDRVLKFQTVKVSSQVSPETVAALKEAHTHVKENRVIEPPSPPENESKEEEGKHSVEGGKRE